MGFIQDQFEKAYNSYNEEAVVQRWLADRLFQETVDICSSFSRILEIGCGTGFLSKEIENRLDYESYYGNDLISDLGTLSSSGKNTYIQGDASQIVLPSNMDLVISSATFQWINEKDVLLKNIHSSLNSDGVFAFSTFGTENLIEVKKATGIGLDYLEVMEWVKLLHEFDILYTLNQKKTIFFEDPVNVLRHLKNTGVNSIKKVSWTKKDLLRFEESYIPFKTEEGYTLTYDPIIIIARKL